MANDPSIILADEPTGALDSATGRMVMDFSGLTDRNHIRLQLRIRLHHKPKSNNYSELTVINAADKKVPYFLKTMIGIMEK